MDSRGEDAALQAIGAHADADIQLAEAALALSAFDDPTQDLGPARAHLEELAAPIAPTGPDVPVTDRVTGVNFSLFETYGYRGDGETYDDLANADLAQVITRRRGLPVALAILYIHIARARGWQIEGVNFPGHFLVRFNGPGGPAIVDPFRGGKLVSPADLTTLLRAGAGARATLSPLHLQPAGNRDILLRLRNNIKTRRTQAGDISGAALVLRSMILIAPDMPPLWHEYGALLAEQGALTGAIAALEKAAQLGGDGPTARHAEGMIKRLKQRLN